MASDRSKADRVVIWAEAAAFAAAVAAVVAIELARHPEFLAKPRSILAYQVDSDTTFVALAILAAPLVWRLGRRRHDAARAVDPPAEAPVVASVPDNNGGLKSGLVACCLSALVFCLSVGLTWFIGQSFRGMPPAYHDEYSYTFQAKTFLAGRLYFEPHRRAEFFDQMHVLNDRWCSLHGSWTCHVAFPERAHALRGVFAGRYFPGVGLWLAPWVAAGRPYWGQYVAGGFIAVLVFWIGRELGPISPRGRRASTEAPRLAVASETAAADSLTSRASGGFACARSNAVGLLAALFCAISPATMLFGNLLVSHHPTTLGLAAFVLSYLRAQRSERLAWPLVGGLSLSFAMLCRPLTAFGFALPFAVHLAWQVLTGRLARAGARVATALAPIVAGIALLGGYDAALTGSPLKSPYGLYTEIYSPKHAYGFHNVTRGEQGGGPKVIKNYDDWATELTLPRALQLAGQRADAAAVWSVGRVSLAWMLGAAVVALPWASAGWRLVAAAAVGVHAAYFPYAFEGIFNLSYVFESVPVLCLLTAGTCGWMAGAWSERRFKTRIVWLAAFAGLGLLGPWRELTKPSTPEKPEGGWLVQVRFARAYYAGFEDMLARAGVTAPALVFVSPDPTAVHLSLITNSPTLDDPILRVRDLGRAKNAALALEFPDRQVWLFDARTRQLNRGR